MQSIEERFDEGKAIRANNPRESHAMFPETTNRDAIAILAESDPLRVQSLVPLRYERMLTDPFAFLRGAAAVMAADLAGAPIAGIPVQACGDCHLMNFGAFATPEDRILFDINDFDETLPGVDFTVDLKRLAASVAVAALAARMPKKRAQALAEAVVLAYRDRIFDLHRLSPLELWHSRIDLEAELPLIADKGLQRRLKSIMQRARGKLEEDDNFPHLVKADQLRIADKPPFIYHLTGKSSDDSLDAASAFDTYRNSLLPDRRHVLDGYALQDVAFKVVGVGSVGTFCAIALFISGNQQPLFLQIKEARPSALERLAPDRRFAGHQGQRVVEGQRALQAASDIFLGWAADEKTGRQFYMRQLKNRKLGSVAALYEQDALADYAMLCGRTLARAHARTGDPAKIAGYIGRGSKLAKAIGAFSMAYAAQTEQDYAALAAARPAQTPSAKRVTA